MSEGGFRSWANVAKFRKMLREVAREGVPPEIGPTVSVKEAMALLGKSRTYVTNRLADGKLNAWKDPVSGRLHVRLEEVEWLRAAQCKMQNAKCKMQNGPGAAGVAAGEEDEEDDGKPWSWDDVCAAQVVEDWEAESERRYQARLAELMAELEPAPEDDNETVKQGDNETGRPAAAGCTEPAEPVSPCLPPSLSPCLPLERPFPVGWVGCRVAAAMLDVCEGTLNRMAAAGKLERRRVDGRGPWLYDTVEVERLAAEILARRPGPGKHEDVRWWGSRAQEWELGPFDYWMSAKQAAELLGVGRSRISALCRRGLLACRQSQPGKRGCKLWVPNTRVMTLKEQMEHAERRARWEKGRRRTAQPVAWEAVGIGPMDLRGESASTRKDRGELYTTRQAALRLGVSTASVRTLRERGRLEGVHVKRKNPSRGALQWWFFRKAEVEALAGEAAYRRNSARGKRAQRLRREA